MNDAGLVAAVRGDRYRPGGPSPVRYRPRVDPLLWHTAFGYLIVWRLLTLVRLFGRLPDGFSRTFAAVLDAATRPFHAVNYLGSVGGALVSRGPPSPSSTPAAGG